MTKPLLLDGAMGTELRARGARVPSHRSSIWSAAALEEAPALVLEVHAAYLAAGADVITANNYAVTGPLLARAGLAHRVEPLTRVALELARRAVDERGAAARVAASLPPLETSYRADLVPNDATLADEYRRIRDAAAPLADVLLCETMSCAREALAAATAGLESDREVWVSFTLQGNRPNRLPGGERLADALAAVAALRVGGRRVDALLVNCCGANLVAGALPLLARAAEGRPFGGYANADVTLPGEFDATDPERVPRRPLAAADFAAHGLDWVAAGATLVGGCCDSRPAHLRALAEGLRESERPASAGGRPPKELPAGPLRPRDPDLPSRP